MNKKQYEDCINMATVIAKTLIEGTRKITDNSHEFSDCAQFSTAMIIDILVEFCKESFGKKDITYKQHAENWLKNVKATIGEVNEITEWKKN